MNRRLAAFAAGLCLASGNVSAADRLCAAEAKADGQQVSVVLRFDGHDQPVLRAAYWRPRVNGAPSDGADPPGLQVGYDISGDALGPISSVGVLAWADLDPLPASKSAWVQVRLDGGRTWAVPWGMFADSVGRIEEIQRTYDGYEVGGFAGNVVVATTPQAGRRGRNPELLAAVPAARGATVAIVGDAGEEDLGRSTAELADTAVRDVLFAKAYAQASAAAADPGPMHQGRGLSLIPVTCGR